jgi:type IV pilus assembly protein PilW
MGLSQRGAGLVEIMIALTLGLLLTAGLFQVYLGSKQSYRLQDSMTRRQEALRYAVMLLTKDLRMSGYRGCLRDTGQVKNTLNSPGNYLYNFAQHVQGFNANVNSWLPALDASLGTVVQGTDVLTVRRTSDPGVYITQSMPNTSADLKVQDNLSPAPFVTGGGDVVLITDCGGAAVFQITQYTVASGNIVHNAGSGGGLPVPGNSTKDLGRRYPVGSEIISISTVSYFIRDSASGTGPALWRRIGNAQEQELVEGIDNMQVLYGEDTDGDQVPDAYRTANSVVDWRNVTVARVALLATGLERSLDEPDPRTFTLLDQVVGPFGDQKLRRVISVTVSLRNRLS